MEHIVTFLIIGVGALWMIVMAGSFFGKLFSTLFPSRRKTARVEAEAVVLKMEAINSFVSNMSKVRLQVQVKPKEGRNFVTEINELLPETMLTAVKTGSVIRVRYNPHNNRELLLVSAA